MKLCNCTIPYINPGACKNCSNNYIYDDSFTYKPYEPVEVFTIPKKKITKEYDKDGKLIKEVIEDL